MDRGFGWFFAGIAIGIINTALFAAFIGIPGIETSNAEDEPATVATAAAGAEKTFVIVVDEQGNVVAQRTELAPGATPTPAPTAPASDAPTSTATATASPTPTATPVLGLQAPRFAEVDAPWFVSARSGTAYVTTRTFGISRVNLDGEVSSQSLDGIANRGGSVVVDVDVTSNGMLYALVVDDPLAWRLFSLLDGEDDWVERASADSAGWAADVIALTATDSGSVYIASNDPAGVYVIEGDMRSVMPWVTTQRPVGLDTTAEDSRLVFAAPQINAAQPASQLQFVYSGRFGTWATNYQSCPAAGSAVPRLPRDVAIVDGAPGSDDTALVVDSQNHAVWLQAHYGDGALVFGRPCEAGSDDAHLDTPSSVAIDEQGNVFIADTNNDRVVALRTGTPRATATATAKTAPPKAPAE